MDLSDLIDRNAAFTPAKAALRFAGTTLSYAELAGRIVDTARALKSQLGIARGDRIAILASNHPDYLVLLYACARLGAMLVPLNWRLALVSFTIIPLMLGDAKLAPRMAEKLLAEGVYVIGFSYPVVPRDQARIRTQMSAGLTLSDLDRALRAFGKVGRELKLIQ